MEDSKIGSTLNGRKSPVKGIAEAVKVIGFGGFLTLEQDSSTEDMKETCGRYVNLMKEYLA